MGSQEDVLTVASESKPYGSKEAAMQTSGEQHSSGGGNREYKGPGVGK